MLSFQLVRQFAAIGARLRVKTAPKQRRSRLALRRDESGEYFELILPRVSPGYVQMMELAPREQRLIMQCGSASKSRWRVQRQANRWVLAHEAEDEREMLFGDGDSSLLLA